MKQILKYLSLTCFIFVFFILGQAANAQEVIDNFQVNIKINQDASIDVVESIFYNFNNTDRHGIYRDIPIKYKMPSGNYNLIISDIFVTDENKQPRTYTLQNIGEYKRIKIGDADILINGLQFYKISYKIQRAINYEETFDELFWNATGDNWTAPITQATAIVELPISLQEVRVNCFSGNFGSTQNCTEIIPQENSVTFYQENIIPGQGLTILTQFPKNTVYQPTILEKIIATIKDNWIAFLPLLAFILLFYLWKTQGKDPAGRGTIIPEYETAESLTPAEIGTIFDERVDSRDISAEIINLAVKGYLKIYHTADKGILDKFSKADNYVLEKLKESELLPNEFERKLMSSLFKVDYIKNHEIDGKNIRGVRLSALKNKFYKDLKDIKKQVYKSVVKKGYFVKNPETVRTIYTTIGIIIVFFLPGFVGSLFGGIGTISLIITGALIIAFGFIMPKKTKQGVLIKEHTLGLKNYLTVAEKDRLDFHNAPEKKPEIFEKLLPAAIALKVEDKWAKQFENIFTQQPSWYSDSTMTNFNSMIFVNNLSTFTSTAHTSMASTPGSSGGGGGGFSGGGFGGGGGGSW